MPTMTNLSLETLLKRIGNLDIETKIHAKVYDRVFDLAATEGDTDVRAALITLSTKTHAKMVRTKREASKLRAEAEILIDQESSG